MKKITALFLTLTLIGNVCFGCGKKETRLTWALFNMNGDQQVYLDALNEALEEKGLPFHLSFVNITIPFRGDYKAYVREYIEEIKKGEFDLVSCPGIQNCYDTYRWMVDEELLTPLNDFLEGESGQKLKEAYPAMIWDSLEEDGKIYGVLTPNTDLIYYGVFQMDYVEKYGIDVSTVTFSELESFMQAASEGEMQERNEAFVVSTPWQYIMLGQYETSPCELIYIREEQGKWNVENILEDSEWVAHVEQMNRWGKQGLIARGDYRKAISQGDFFVTGVYSYCEEAAEEQIRNNYGISEEIRLLAVEFPEFNQKWKGNGYKTAVLSGSKQKETAMEVLAEIYSDDVLSNALVYGKEGISYEIKNGQAFFLGDYEFTGNIRLIGFGNPFLMLPSFKDSSKKRELLRTQMEQMPVSKLSGIYFDLKGFDESISQLNVCFLERYQELLLGMSDNVTRDLKRLKEEAEALGISQVVEGLAKQLEKGEGHEVRD